MSKTALYRHFDAGGQLLYVGISNDALRRLCQHKDRSSWYEQIRRVDVEWLPSREEALAAEAIAIAKEAPAFNVRLARAGTGKAMTPAPAAQSRGMPLGVAGTGRAHFESFPPWADNEVRCRGEHLDPVVWQNEQWAVTTHGLECRDGTYVIEARRLWKDEDKVEQHEGAGWSSHMAHKSWVDAGAFDEALRVARVIHTGTANYVEYLKTGRKSA